MLRVLTLATLYPSSAEPTLGLFVERQTRTLAARPDVEVRVVAPIGLPPWPLSLHPHYARPRAAPDHEEREGVIVHHPRFRAWPGRQGERARALAGALLPFLERMRREFAFEMIDAEYFWPDGPAAMRLARALGVPFSIKARGSDILYWAHQPGISEQILAAGRAAGGMLAVSEALAADMASLGLPADRIRVHRTGIDLDRFAPVDREAAKAELGIAGPLLITAGGLIPRKGQEVAIAALARLPGATLLLAGDGPDRRQLDAAARRHGVGERVRFLGPLPQQALARLLAAADVAVQPSNAEGLANVWVEALACGTPVVTCDVGGAREAIDRPAAGRLVARDPDAVAVAVRELLANPPAPEEVRASAARFSWERNAGELFAHLSAVAAGKAPAG